LLIIDDAWREQHIRPFLGGALSTTRLITTRRDDILPQSAVRVPVDAMSEPEAVALLKQGFTSVNSAVEADLRRLANERLGEWPILLRLVNRFLHNQVNLGETLAR